MSAYDNKGEYYRTDGIFDKKLNAIVYTYCNRDMTIVGFIYANPERTKAVLVYFQPLLSADDKVVIRVHRTTASYVDDPEQFGGTRLDAPIDPDNDEVFETITMTRSFLGF